MSQRFWTFYEDAVWRQPLLGTAEALVMNRGAAGYETDSTPAMIGITDDYAILITGYGTTNNGHLPETPVYAAPLSPASTGNQFPGAKSFIYEAGYTPDPNAWFEAPDRPAGRDLVEAFGAVITLGGNRIAVAGIDGLRIGEPGKPTLHVHHNYDATLPIGQNYPRGFSLSADGKLTMVCAGLLMDGETPVVLVSEEIDPAAPPGIVTLDRTVYTYDGANEFKACAAALAQARGSSLSKAMVFVPFAVAGDVYRRGKSVITIVGQAKGGSVSCATLPDAIYSETGNLQMSIINSTLTYGLAGSHLTYALVNNSSVFNADAVVGDYAYSAGMDGEPDPIPAFWYNHQRTAEMV